VDPSGELPDGRTFANAEEFKQLLLDDTEQFARTFVEKLATYSLRRAMTFEDHDELESIVKDARAADYRVKDTLEAFVLSDLFQKR